MLSKPHLLPNRIKHHDEIIHKRIPKQHKRNTISSLAAWYNINGTHFHTSRLVGVTPNRGQDILSLHLKDLSTELHCERWNSAIAGKVGVTIVLDCVQDWCRREERYVGVVDGRRDIRLRCSAVEEARKAVVMECRGRGIR